MKNLIALLLMSLAPVAFAQVPYASTHLTTAQPDRHTITCRQTNGYVKCDGNIIGGQKVDDYVRDAGFRVLHRVSAFITPDGRQFIVMEVSK